MVQICSLKPSRIKVHIGEHKLGTDTDTTITEVLSVSKVSLLSQNSNKSLHFKTFKNLAFNLYFTIWKHIFIKKIINFSNYIIET